MDSISLELDKAWRDACRVLFGTEIGSCQEYAVWLAELVDAPIIKKSSISGKEVIHSTQDYSSKSKSISLDEVDQAKKYSTITIGQTADMVNIVKTIQDRVYYTGNVILGNSKYVQKSSNINDSFYVYNSTLSGNSKYLAFCTLARLDNYGFGGNAFSQCDFCLKCHELTRVKRSFELWMSQDCSDCYYSHGLKNCSHCFFCFNLENKRYCIGNVEIGPERYKVIKGKLIAELVAEVKLTKRLPSLVELVAMCGNTVDMSQFKPPTGVQQPNDKSKIEATFAKTIQIILKKPLPKGIDAYAVWLIRHTRGLEKCKSAATGQDVFIAHYGNYSDLPKNRLLTLDEAKLFGAQIKLDESEIQDLNLQNIQTKLGKIAFFNTDIQDGQCVNNVECTISIDAVNCYRTVCSVYSKYCAYSFWPRSSQYIFGCDTIFDSSFCVNCYHSVGLQRCFELDGCSSSSDCYFCHNCENIQDSMFCFNTKNKKYAVGNVEIGREQYIVVKEKIIEQISAQLEKSDKLDIDIFSL